MRTLALLGVVVAGLSASVASAQIDSAGRKKVDVTAQSTHQDNSGLKGLHSAFLIIDQLGAGLDSAALFAQMQLKLRQHGFTVSAERQGAATLWLNVIETKPAGTPGMVVMDIALSLGQNAYLERLPKAFVPLAITWTQRAVIVTPSPRTTDEMRETVSELLDLFLHDWLAENPPRAAP